MLSMAFIYKKKIFSSLEPKPLVCIIDNNLERVQLWNSQSIVYFSQADIMKLYIVDALANLHLLSMALYILEKVILDATVGFFMQTLV